MAAVAAFLTHDEPCQIMRLISTHADSSQIYLPRRLIFAGTLLNQKQCIWSFRN